MIDLRPRGKGRLYNSLLIGAAVSALSVSLYGAGVFEPYELKTFDTMMRHLSKRSGSPDVVIVEVDQGSLDSLAKEGITWPWPRQVYGPIVSFLSSSGAKAVFFDILMTEASSYGSEDDRVLGESVRDAGNVYIPFFLSKGEGEGGEAEGAFIDRHSLRVNAGAGGAPEFKSVVLPIPEIAQSARGMGNVQMPPDPDGVYRRLPLLFYYKGRWFPQLCFAYLSDEAGGVITLGRDSIGMGGISIPYEGGLFRLKYYGGPRYYKRYPAADLIRSRMDMEEGKTPKLNPDLFRGKYVFIGLTAPGLYDLKATPVSSIYPGVAVHATFLDNIIRSDYMVRVDRKILFAIIMAISLLPPLVILTTPSLLRNMIYFAGFAVLLIAGAMVSFGWNHLLDTVSPLFSYTMSFAVNAAFSYSTEGRKRREIRRVFSLYMNESLVDDLLNDPEQLRLGGEKRVLTVFFSDLKDFTSLCEKRSPEDVVRLLNIYLTAMTEIILNRGGIIDKYQGDGIMAFWGAPIKGDEDERQACLAAIENQEMLSKLRREFEGMGFPPLYARIGINTGEMIVGNMGSERRFDYTVIGDNVNLASRLEGVNKLYSTGIIVSESTYLGTRDHFDFRELDTIRVKGREEYVRVYELMGRKGDLGGERLRLRELFEEGLSLYKERRWGEAMERFDMCLKIDRDDGPSREYLKRCREKSMEEVS